MKNLELIAAIGKNNELGCNNDLIWHIKQDMQSFKSITMNKSMIMGMNTYNSMPKNLAGRKYIVLTRKDITIPNVKIYHSKDSLLDDIKDKNDGYIVIGGAQIYNLFINDVEIMYLTKIDDTCKADVYFPEFNEEEFDKSILIEGVENYTHYKQYKYVRRR